jgi:hypothetical protein
MPGADFMLCKRPPRLLEAAVARVFPGSSAVEQPAVNRLVAGSNPARGATLSSPFDFSRSFPIFVKPLVRFDTRCSCFHLFHCSARQSFAVNQYASRAYAVRGLRAGTA